MSIDALNTVFKHSRAKGAGFVIMLALADWANQDGEAWPALETIARKARVSVRTVTTEIKRLAKIGELSIATGAGRNGTNVYTIRIGGWQSEAKNPGLGWQSSARQLPTNHQEPPEEKRTKTNTAARSQSSRAGVGTNAKPPRGKTWGDGCPEFPIDRRIERIDTAGSPRPKAPKHEPPQDPLMQARGKKPPGSAAPPKAGLFGVEEPKVPADEIVVRDAFQLAYENQYGLLATWSGAESRQAKTFMQAVRQAAERRRVNPVHLLAQVIAAYLADNDPFLIRKGNAHRFLLLAQRAPGYLSDVLKLGNKRSNPADTDGVMW
jgi:hypothetical protein